MAIRWDYTPYSQFIDDTHDWCDRLPQISAVTGIPRSGVLPAFLIAQRKAIPLLSIEAVIYHMPQRPTHYNQLRELPGPILVVDDGYWTGETIKTQRQEMHGLDVIFGSVYARHPFEHLDTWGHEVTNEFGTFEYNFMRQGFTARYVVSIDAIRDRNGKPTYLLPTFPVMSIVTTDAGETMTWLIEHGVQCNRVVRAVTEAEKAIEYNFDQESTLFVEADSRAAQEIQRLTQRPVFATDVMRVIQ